MLEAIEQLHALGCGVDAKLLEKIGEAIDSDEWKADGARSLDAWLAYRLGWSKTRAAEAVRIAGALRTLPAIARTYFEGRISFDQLRSLTLIADDESDTEWAERGQTCSAAELARIAQRCRAATQKQIDEGRKQHLRFWKERGGTGFRGHLPAISAPELQGRVDARADQIMQATKGQDAPLYEWARAQALLELVRGEAGGKSVAPKASIVVLADAAAIAMRYSWAELERGPQIPVALAKRRFCFGRVTLATRDDAGQPLGIGRAAPIVPGWLYHMLWERDHGCAFPGCGYTNYVEAHHVLPWEDGGPTDYDNLILMCSWHHDLIHREHWRVHRGKHGWRFIRPDSKPLLPGPPKLRDDVRTRFFSQPEHVDTS